MKLRNIFKKFFKNLKKQNNFKHVLIIEKNSSITPKKNTIIIIKKNNIYSWAKFYCPCGCGKEIMLSLNSNIKPCWNIKLNKIKGDFKVTLSPSINLTSFPCKSHFFIRNNRVDWV